MFCRLDEKIQGIQATSLAVSASVYFFRYIPKLFQFSLDVKILKGQIPKLFRFSLDMSKKLGMSKKA